MGNGRKRHLAVDTLGLLLAVVVTSAAIDDAAAAPDVLHGSIRPWAFGPALPRMPRVAPGIAAG